MKTATSICGDLGHVVKTATKITTYPFHSDSIGHWERTKNYLTLSASVQALRDHDDVERRLLMVLEEDSDVEDDKYGHLGPVWSVALKEHLNGDAHKKEDYLVAFAAAAAELAELLTNNPQPLAKRSRGHSRKVSTVCSMP